MASLAATCRCVGARLRAGMTLDRVLVNATWEQGHPGSKAAAQAWQRPQDCRVAATRGDGVAEDMQLAGEVWRVTEEQLRAARP